jgi:hypothetical protein
MEAPVGRGARISMELSRIARFLYWDVERGTLAYDILCLVVLLLLIVVSPCWLGDPMVLCP